MAWFFICETTLSTSVSDTNPPTHNVITNPNANLIHKPEADNETTTVDLKDIKNSDGTSALQPDGN